MDQTHAFSISLIKPVGEVSEGKVNKLAENGYRLSNIINGQLAQLIAPESGDLLVIGQNQITYVPLPENVDCYFSDSSKIVDRFEKVIDVLLLDNTSIFEITFERSYDTENDSFEISRDMLKDSEFLSGIGSKAVGLRIPFLKEGFQGELRMEPMFNNQKRYFFGFKARSLQPIDVSKGAEILYTITSYIVIELEPLIKSIYTKEK